MVESQSVQHLVLDDAKVDAAEPLQRHHLLLPKATHGGETAGEGREMFGDDQRMNAATPGLVWLSYPCLGSKLKYILSVCLGLKRMQVLVWNSFRPVTMVFISSWSASLGQSVSKKAGERESAPILAPPTILFTDDEGDPHVPIRGLGPQAVKSIIKAFHCIPDFGNRQISFQQELR